MWTQWKRNSDAWLLKESVIWIHHGIELLLKQLVVQSNEFLVFQDVNKAVERLGILRKKDGMENAGVLDLFDYDEKIMSVGFKNLIDRVAITLNIEELSEKKSLRNKIDKLTRIRNKIVHFSIELDIFEISELLSEILNPLLSLLYKGVHDQDFRSKTIPEIRKIAQPLHVYMEYVRKEIVDSAIKATKDALPPNGNGKAGVVSQALGSGLTKSLSSYLEIIKGIYDKKIVILVDRQDIAHQLYQLVSRESGVNPILPGSKEELSSLIVSDDQEVIICMVQKIYSYDFEFNCDCLVVGYDIRSIPENFETFFSNATYILFTSSPSRLAPSFYGRVVGSYDLTQAIKDSVSTPLRIEKIDWRTSVDQQAEDSLEVHGVERVSCKYVDSSLSLDFLAEKIVAHFELNETQYLSKAYVVVRDIDTANVLFDKILNIKPKLRGVTSSNVVSAISSNMKVDKKELLRKKFIDKDSSLLLLIGTGSFLIGYDNPLLSTVYLTCTVSHHVQYKISSVVTRPAKDKEYGLIVDFIGFDWYRDNSSNK